MLWAEEETLGLVYIVQKGTKLTCNKGKANIVILPHFKNFWLTNQMYTYILSPRKNQILNDSVVCCVWCTYTVEFQYKIPTLRFIFLWSWH
jgi:hypothetical protein